MENTLKQTKTIKNRLSIETNTNKTEQIKDTSKLLNENLSNLQKIINKLNVKKKFFLQYLETKDKKIKEREKQIHSLEEKISILQSLK